MESAAGGMMVAVVDAAEAWTAAAEPPGSDSTAPGHVADVSSTGWRSWSSRQTSRSTAAESIVQSKSAAHKHLVEQRW